VPAIEGGTVTATRLGDADVRLRDAVMWQLNWDPEVEASAVGVTARNGVVTLTGYIDSYAGKLAAERAAKRVTGVRAVANDIDVRLKLERTDDDIAADAARALEMHATIPEGVQAVVHDARVTLTGKVRWLYQKHAAEDAVRHLRGVRGVMNHIAVTPHASVRDVRRRIVKALHQNADVDARQISVTVTGDRATLTGTARTWLQRDFAERAVANAPGIGHVDNQIVVMPAVEAEGGQDEVC
jgi:osmotically-inducible protein OsmY